MQPKVDLEDFCFLMFKVCLKTKTEKFRLLNRLYSD